VKSMGTSGGGCKLCLSAYHGCRLVVCCLLSVCCMLLDSDNGTSISV